MRDVGPRIRDRAHDGNAGQTGQIPHLARRAVPDDEELRVGVPLTHRTEAPPALDDAATGAFIAVCLLLITGVLTWSDVADHKRAWTTFAWLGALIALCDGLNRVGFVKWFADGIAAHMHGFSPRMAMLVLLGLFFVAHYVFASVDAYTTALLPVILLYTIYSYYVFRGKVTGKEGYH